MESAGGGDAKSKRKGEESDAGRNRSRTRSGPGRWRGGAQRGEGRVGRDHVVWETRGGKERGVDLRFEGKEREGEAQERDRNKLICCGCPCDSRRQGSRVEAELK